MEMDALSEWVSVTVPTSGLPFLLDIELVALEEDRL